MDNRAIVLLGLWFDSAKPFAGSDWGGVSLKKTCTKDRTFRSSLTALTRVRWEFYHWSKGEWSQANVKYFCKSLLRHRAWVCHVSNLCVAEEQEHWRKDILLFPNFTLWLRPIPVTRAREEFLPLLLSPHSHLNRGADLQGISLLLLNWAKIEYQATKTLFLPRCSHDIDSAIPT